MTTLMNAVQCPVNIPGHLLDEMLRQQQRTLFSTTNDETSRAAMTVKHTITRLNKQIEFLNATHPHGGPSRVVVVVAVVTAVAS